jgi:type II secretory pathway component PulC
VRQGVIARSELVPVLNRGLGRYLQNVETEPSFHRGAFVGFRIVSLFPGELGYASLDLRPGDTVTRVNGKPIERPEQAVAVWEELRTASDLVVDYERNGEALQLRFAIVDES